MHGGRLFFAFPDYERKFLVKRSGFYQRLNTSAHVFCRGFLQLNNELR
jgi:hypothetical protein